MRDGASHDTDALDTTAQRLLNLAFVLNVAPRPLRTDEIVADADLGYGSGNRESDLRKFRRDRDRRDYPEKGKQADREASR